MTVEGTRVVKLWNGSLRSTIYMQSPLTGFIAPNKRTATFASASRSRKKPFRKLEMYYVGSSPGIYPKPSSWDALAMLARLLPRTTSQLCHRLLSSSNELALRYRGSEASVWVQFVGLAMKHKALNLGQGFPDYHAPPAHAYQGLADVALDESPLLNQYTRGFGTPRLVAALSQLYSQLTQRPVDQNSEVLVTTGAYEALFCAFNSLLNPDDEVIIIEPFFDCYAPMARTCGAVPRFIPLRPQNGGKTSADWRLDPEELEKLFNEKTRVIVVNTPHNPLGKIFDREELQVVADLCQKHDVICFSDEVYEWLTYEKSHLRIATLPGMWDRTVTFGSAGKTFSLTGWKLGWAYGPADLLRCLQIAHQNCVYTNATPLQEACARSFEIELARLGTPESYFTSLPASLRPKRDSMAEILQSCGLEPVVPEGGYFMFAKYDSLGFTSWGDTSERRDYQLVKWLTTEHKLATIPASAFYSAEHAHLGEDYIRFCFIKKDETLQKAGEILKSIKSWKP